MARFGFVTMTLAEFIEEIWTAGTCTVSPAPMPVEEENELAALAWLQRCYAEDIRHQPAPMPAFEAAAALWAARFLYRAVQLTVLRELDDTAVRVWLQEFPGLGTPEAQYSADLLLRHLPDLLRLCQGLAPADALVLHLQATLVRWPLSAVGAKLPDLPDPAPVLGHPGLRLLYADRLLAIRDLPLARHPAARELLREVLGQFAPDLWPEFHALLNEPVESVTRTL
ncbi:hypothetical protein [Hymenobacter sp. UYP22]|uniref:hypothetical protein n=1 Tax=Hymenobacter sp. UYP22 TaxID=3156348 RepID=UPI0033976F20